MNSIRLVEPLATQRSGAADEASPLPARFKSDAVKDGFETAGVIWLAGAVLSLAACAALYALTASRLKRARPSSRGDLLEECSKTMGVRRHVALLVSDEIASPVAFGVLRPRVIVPKALEDDEETLRYALLHELVHTRRGDAALRLASAAVACLHWFNPLVWLFLSLSARDMEQACDAGVLRRLPDGQRKGYAMALANLAKSRQPAFAAAFGRSAVRSRIIGIAKYRRLTLGAAAVLACLLFALAVALLTNPAI